MVLFFSFAFNIILSSLLSALLMLKLPSKELLSSESERDVHEPPDLWDFDLELFNEFRTSSLESKSL